MRKKIFIICFFLASCSSSKTIETQLYFGQSRPDGSNITKEEWNHFKETNLSGIFKEGSTIFSATGNWYDSARHELISEPTYVVVYIHKKSSRVSKQIDSLKLLYKQMFQQQSILRTDKKIKASF